jgi:hypothetical protein
MRPALVAIVLLLFTVPTGFAQDAKPWSSDRYPVEARPLAGWNQTLTQPTPAGQWIDLLRFEEAKAGAKLTLSVQASTYRNGEEMIARMKEQFGKDASLAILRTDSRPVGAKSPAWLFFEYTRKGDKGPEHCIAAYWFHMGHRYRVYGFVREVGWKVVGADMERFATTGSFSGRVFSKDPQNYTDDALNFAIWFPEDWRIRLPAGGPRVTFSSDRLGLAVWITVKPVKTELDVAVPALVEELKGRRAVVKKEGAIVNHPVLNMPVATIEYLQGAGDEGRKHVETVIVHRELLYRIALVGKEADLAAGLEPFDRMVNSLSFMK